VGYVPNSPDNDIQVDIPNGSIVVNLLVDNMSPVLWNKDAFESLALDEETKVLITALVTNKITTNISVDIMSGKGNGLIVLLHG
jgi:hypothetical protein